MEARLGFEYLDLMRSPLYKGVDAPKSNGQAILLIPGFLAGDWTLATLKGWLERCGYKVKMSGISFNVADSEYTMEGIEKQVGCLERHSGGKITIIGQSRGGLLASVFAHRHPEMVKKVIMLGSPIANPFDVHPFTMAGVKIAGIAKGLNYSKARISEIKFLDELRERVAVPTHSLYSRSDGIINWETCVREDVVSHRIHSSHVGMAVNREAYQTMAEILPQKKIVASFNGLS
jgi:pimeloyl-ACP methyl ester carboxylesterase